MALVPANVDIHIKPLGLYTAELTGLAGKRAVHVARTAEFAKDESWEGVAIMGAPMEVQNPGLTVDIRAAVSIPVTTALEAGAAALRALGTRKALLLCPFDERLKGMLRDHLAGEGIEAMLPSDAFETITNAAEQTPEQVYELAKDRLSKAPGAQAIYFQGAPLNPVPVLDQLEADLGVPVIGSNPTMMWHILSKLGLDFKGGGKGRLLREWPDLVAI
jgi:maleate cis-trans isomerase